MQATTVLECLLLTLTRLSAVFFAAADTDSNQMQATDTGATPGTTGYTLHPESELRLALFPTLRFDPERVAPGNLPRFDDRPVPDNRMKLPTAH